MSLVPWEAPWHINLWKGLGYIPALHAHPNRYGITVFSFLPQTLPHPRFPSLRHTFSTLRHNFHGFFKSFRRPQSHWVWWKALIFIELITLFYQDSLWLQILPVLIINFNSTRFSLIASILSDSKCSSPDYEDSRSTLITDSKSQLFTRKPFVIRHSFFEDRISKLLSKHSTSTIDLSSFRRYTHLFPHSFLTLFVETDLPSPRSSPLN